MTEMNLLSDKVRNDLTEQYIDKYLEGLSTRDMIRILGEQFREHLDQYTDQELLNEIDAYFPHLLEDNVTPV